MFCPKCGSELREGASFCPKCGTKIENRTEPAAAPVKKVPEFQEIKKNLPEMKQVETFIKSIPPKMAAGIAAAVVILILAVGFLGRPNMKNLDTEKLTEKYFEDQLDYLENNYMYEACFNYMAQDLTAQLTKKVAPILRTFDLYEPARLEEVQAQGLRICDHCHQIITLDSAFCNKCGSKLEPIVPSSAGGRFCPACGASLAEGDVFCVTCGAKVN